MPILKDDPLKPFQVQLRIIIFSCFCIVFFPKIIIGAPLSIDALQISASVQPFKAQEAEKYKLKVIQPYRFDKTTLVKAMSSLAYQKRGVSWSNNRRVFNSAVNNQLALMIEKNYLYADTNQRIVFHVKNAKGKTILAGDTFLATDGLHWRMTAIQKIRRTVDDFSVSGDSWRLIPLTHQTYKTKEKIKGLVQDITNWIVFDQIKPDPERIMHFSDFSEEKQSAPTRKSFDLKERLKILEDLKREGMINEEEYNIKRQKILDDL